MTTKIVFNLLIFLLSVTCTNGVVVVQDKACTDLGGVCVSQLTTMTCSITGQDCTNNEACCISCAQRRGYCKSTPPAKCGGKFLYGKCTSQPSLNPQCCIQQSNCNYPDKYGQTLDLVYANEGGCQNLAKDRKI